MSQTYSTSLDSPVIEAGLVRFKFGVSAEIQAGSATPNPILETLTGQIEETLPGFTSTQTIADLIAQPTSTRFAGLLFNCGLHRHLAVNDWLTLQITADQTFCFFTITANITAALNSAQDMQATRVGSQAVTRSTSVSVSFGPSRAAWLGMGLRLGPQFTAFAARMMPSIAPTASAGAAGAATQSMFSTWVGPIGWAIPIGILIRDFVVIICDSARQQGVRRGEYNQVGRAYVWHAYGMRPYHSSDPDATSAGISRAQEDIRRYGVASVRRYLEQHFRQGRAMPTAHSSAGGFYYGAVQDVGYLLGEEMYRQAS
jgi:hypothetical protein